jgi:TonB family protein
VRAERGTFRRAIELSLLLHLVLLLLVLPEIRRVWPASESLSEAFVITPPDVTEQPPLDFELVDIPAEEETPREDAKPLLSDQDRRAHGGEGEQADTRPKTTGNTPQLVQADGGQRFGRGAPPVPPQQPRPEVPEPQEPTEPRPTPAPEPAEEIVEGAAEEEPKDDEPEEEAQPEQQPRLTLPPRTAWALPPDVGGLPETPDRDGGSVDTGPLSFDTQWYDWGPYAAKMLRAIRRSWRIPEIARLGVSGMCKIRFYIERDGTVSGVRILTESGRPPMDFAARDAIRLAAPFDPLPTDLTGVDREGVTISFYYNMRPDDYGRRGE